MNFLTTCFGVHRISNSDSNIPQSNPETKFPQSLATTSTMPNPFTEKHAKLPSSERTSPSFIRAAATSKSKPSSSLPSQRPTHTHAPNCPHRPPRFWYYPANRLAENDEEETLAKLQMSHRQCCHPEKWTRERHGIEWSEVGDEERRKHVEAFDSFMAIVVRGRGCT